MQLYDLFIKEEILTHKVQTPFWREFCRLHDFICNKSIGIIQSNIAKVGFEYGNTGFDRDTNMHLRDVFIKEIEICKPDLLLFYTGPSYDRHIVDRFGAFTSEKCMDDFDNRKIAKLNFENSPIKLPSVYRTYHPNYLQQKRFTPIRNYIDNILINTFNL